MKLKKLFFLFLLGSVGLSAQFSANAQDSMPGKDSGEKTATKLVRFTDIEADGSTSMQHCKSLLEKPMKLTLNHLPSQRAVVQKMEFANGDVYSGVVRDEQTQSKAEVKNVFVNSQDSSSHLSTLHWNAALSSSDGKKRAGDLIMDGCHAKFTSVKVAG